MHSGLMPALIHHFETVVVLSIMIIQVNCGTNIGDEYKFFFTATVPNFATFKLGMFFYFLWQLFRCLTTVA